MTRVSAFLVCLLALVRPAGAQDSTAAMLRRARELYEGVNIERVVPLLRQVLSPEWRFSVTTAQRAEAYKYLGASFVLVGLADSAQQMFRAALTREPFTDLNPRDFTPGQIAAFNAARGRSFGVGIRPVAETSIDPRIQRVPFTIVTTHSADVRAVLRQVDRSGSLTVFDDVNDGVRDILWDGLTAEGVLASSGRYELLVTARSRLLPRTDSTRIFFDVINRQQPDEDTLPAIPPGSLLPEREPMRQAMAELGKGAGVAGGVLLVARLLRQPDLGSGHQAAVTTVALAGAAAGIASMIVRASHRKIPANIEANTLRQAKRQEENAAIRRRNAERKARTILVVTPAAGGAP